MDIAQLNDENVFFNAFFFYKNDFYVYCWNDGMFTVGMIAFLNLSSSPSSTRNKNVNMRLKKSSAHQDLSTRDFRINGAKKVTRLPAKNAYPKPPLRFFGFLRQQLFARMMNCIKLRLNR